MIDCQKIETHVYGILEALGEDPQREGLQETPKRVAKMLAEVLAGTNYSNQEIAAMFDKTFHDDLDFANDEIVVVKDIDIFSYCEHHLALMYDMKVTVAYIPGDKVIGLSKIARIADMCARRLQLQERIGSDIAEVISLITNSADVAVIIQGKHSCMTARGIKKVNSSTVTSTLTGRFKTDPKLQIYLR